MGTLCKTSNVEVWENGFLLSCTNKVAPVFHVENHDLDLGELSASKYCRTGEF